MNFACYEWGWCTNNYDCWELSLKIYNLRSLPCFLFYPSLPSKMKSFCFLILGSFELRDQNRTHCCKMHSIRCWRSCICSVSTVMFNALFWSFFNCIVAAAFHNLTQFQEGGGSRLPFCFASGRCDNRCDMNARPHVFPSFERAALDELDFEGWSVFPKDFGEKKARVNESRHST